MEESNQHPDKSPVEVYWIIDRPKKDPPAKADGVKERPPRSDGLVEFRDYRC
jgi:hypothetical protein